MGKNSNNNNKKNLIASPKSVAISQAVRLSVYCIICMKEKEERQLSRESEISKFKEALKRNARVRGIVLRVT
jgi:hypothetical protein